MRLLFVDDVEERLGLLRDVLSRAGALDRVDIVWRPNVPAVTRADVEAADVVFFDHDMCTSQRDDLRCERPTSTGACGCPTGAKLARRAVRWGLVKRAVVHSANPAGAQNIAATLRAAGWDVSVDSVIGWGRYAPTALARVWGLLPAPPRG